MLGTAITIWTISAVFIKVIAQDLGVHVGAGGLKLKPYDSLLPDCNTCNVNVYLYRTAVCWLFLTDLKWSNCNNSHFTLCLVAHYSQTGSSACIHRQEVNEKSRLKQCVWHLSDSFSCNILV